MSDFFTDCGTWGVMLGDCLERLQELPEGCADHTLRWDSAQWCSDGCSGYAGVSAAGDPETLDAIPENEEIPDWL